MKFEDILSEYYSNDIKSLLARHRVVFRAFFQRDDGEDIIKAGHGVYTGKWIYWGGFGTLLGPEEDRYDIKELIGMLPETIGQFVKLGTDGRPIFKHDIVHIHYREYPYGAEEGITEEVEVSYDDDECKWYPMAWAEYCENCDYNVEIEELRAIKTKFDLDEEELKNFGRK